MKNANGANGQNGPKCQKGRLKQNGSVFVNHGLWYYSVRLPGDARRRLVPLRAPNATHTLGADRPRKMAEDAARRVWEDATRTAKAAARDGANALTVNDLCARWARHCDEYYRQKEGGGKSSSSVNAVIDVRLFRDLFGAAAVSELTHADMLTYRDALVRSGASRTTVNTRLWRVKAMLSWALDEALIPALVKAELTQVRGVKRGRSAARERVPVRPIDDSAIDAAIGRMMPNTADMVRLHRVTGMRPCELCALRWPLVDTTRTPWVYRVPTEANKNAWRGEFGQPRVVLIGPRGREILSRHKTGEDAPFSPRLAMAEYLHALHESRVTPVYGASCAKRVNGADGADGRGRPREFGAAWNTAAYGRTIRSACAKAGVQPFGPNRLRHTFGTEVRRAFGLDAAKAVLGHTGGGCITDAYTFEAVEEETIKRASAAVEALG